MTIGISLVRHNSDCWDILFRTSILLEMFQIYWNDSVISKNTTKNMFCVTAASPWRGVGL